MRIIRQLLTGLIILWGLLALFVRVATPLVADYRDELAMLLSERLGVPVAIGGIAARWYGPAPWLELDDVRLGSAPETLRARRISFNLTPTALFGGSLLDALQVTVSGMRLTAVREPTGQLHLEGIGILEYQAARGTTALALPRRMRLVDTELVWIDRKAGKAPVVIDDVAVMLSHDEGRFRLRARLETGDGSAELAARIEGLPTTTAWHGDTYLKVANLDVATLFAQYLPTSYGLDSLNMDFESWGQWQDAAPVHSQGSFELRDLKIHPQDDASRPLELLRTAASYSLQRAEGSLRLGLSGLQFAFADHAWSGGDLAFELHDAADGRRRIEAAADYLRIDDLVRILRVRLPVPALRAPLEALSPRGDLHDLRLSVALDGDHMDWRCRAHFDHLRVNAWDRIPAIDNLGGEVHAQQGHLTLTLDSHDTRVEFAGLFRDPLQLTALNGRLDLLQRDDGWQMRSDLLVADTEHIQTRTRVLLTQRADRSPFIDLQTDFRDGDAAFASRYYPVSILGAGLVDWLDRSIHSGRVVAGTALIHGPLSDFAFENALTGTFRVVFDTEAVALDYRDGWPPIDDLAARVSFHGNQLDIDADNGRIYDSRIGPVHGNIKTLDPIGPLRVKGRLQGPLSNTLRVLQEEALKPRFGRFAEVLHGDGETELLLDFTVPLKRGGEYDLSGRLRFDGATLELPDWDLTMSDIVGRLDFTLDGISASGIRAQALGAPVSVDVLPQADGTTRVRSNGRFDVSAIGRQLPALPLWAASGGAAFQVDVDIPPGREAQPRATTLTVDSRLAGIGIDLPAPFGKQPDAERPLQVVLPLGGPEADGRLRYGDLLAASFSDDGTRVDVALGGGEPQPGTGPGIRVNGRLAEIDLIAWQPVLARLSAGAAGDPPPTTLDLEVSRLQAGDLALDGLHLALAYRDQAWHGRIETEPLAGAFIVPRDPTAGTIRVDLGHLYLTLPVDDDDEAVAPPPDPTDGPDPTGLPGLLLAIDDLRINQARLGRMRVQALRAPEGLRIVELSLRDGQLELDSAGYWSQLGNRAETQLGGRVSTPDLGDLLVGLGYSRQVDEAGGNIGFVLGWPGNPIQAHRTTIAGRLSLDVNAGRLVELDPGVGRVVGLLNLNALTRRLRLDFRDIYKKGYSFDSIRGEFVFDDARATTRDLEVLGPTGRIELDGYADLARRSLEQHVTVTPNLDATLPIAGTIAGGPIAGIAVLLAQRVMTKEVDSLNRFEYSLSGPWRDPEVTQLDTGGTLSKILQPLRGDPARSTPAPSGEPPEAASDRPVPAPETAAETDPAQSPDPVQGLIELLQDSKAYGADLPGESD